MLHNNLKKDASKWCLDVKKVFHKLKEVMPMTPILAITKFTKLFIIEVDGNKGGIQAILCKNDAP